LLNDTPRIFIGTIVLHLDGMTCERCKAAVTDQIGQLDGVSQVTVDEIAGAVTVVAAAPVDRVDVAAAVARAGYDLRPWA